MATVADLIAGSDLEVPPELCSNGVTFNVQIKCIEGHYKLVLENVDTGPGVGRSKKAKKGCDDCGKKKPPKKTKKK